LDRGAVESTVHEHRLSSTRISERCGVPSGPPVARNRTRSGRRPLTAAPKQYGRNTDPISSRTRSFATLQCRTPRAATGEFTHEGRRDAPEEMYSSARNRWPRMGRSRHDDRLRHGVVMELARIFSASGRSGPTPRFRFVYGTKEETGLKAPTLCGGACGAPGPGRSAGPGRYRSLDGWYGSERPDDS